MLRKLGYPINLIGKALGRSTSFIHKTLAVAMLRRSVHSFDMRKLPSAMRQLHSRKRWFTLQKFLPGWELFILGLEDKPP